MASTQSSVPPQSQVPPATASLVLQQLEGKFWYAGSISERKAEQILTKIGQPGVFLVRTSLLPDADYVLSINNNGQDIWHYDITVLPSEECILNKYIFPNIVEAITFYTENRIGGIFLEEPEEPVVSPKELTSTKTSTLVRRAPVTDRSSEPRVSGQYASSLGTETERSDDTLSMDSSTCAQSSSNVHMDWIAAGEEHNISGDQMSPILQHTLETDHENQEIHSDRWQQLGNASGINAEHHVTSSNTNQCRGYGMTATDEDVVRDSQISSEDMDKTEHLDEPRRRVVSIIRQTSRAEQLKELKRLPSIQKMVTLMQRKIEGEDIDSDEADGDQESESPPAATETTSEQHHKAAGSVQQLPPAEEHVAQTSTSRPSGRILLKMKSGPPPPVPNRRTKVKAAKNDTTHAATAAAIRFTIPKPPPPEPSESKETMPKQPPPEPSESKETMPKQPPPEPEPEQQHEIIKRRNSPSTSSVSDNDEDMPPPPPLSTHPEVIAARMSRDFSLDDTFKIVVEKVNESPTEKGQEEEVSRSPIPTPCQEDMPPLDDTQNQDKLSTVVTPAVTALTIATLENLETPSAQKPPPPSPKPRVKKPVPQPRSRRSSLNLEDDSEQQFPSSGLESQVSMPEVRIQPLPSETEPLPPLQEASSPNPSDPSSVLQITSTKPHSPQLPHKVYEDTEDKTPSSPPKDRTPSPSMLRHFYFSSNKVVSVPGEPQQASIEVENTDSATTQRLESPPPVMEVSAPTQVHTLVSCGPMNSRRQLPTKKRKSLFRKK